MAAIPRPTAKQAAPAETSSQPRVKTASKPPVPTTKAAPKTPTAPRTPIPPRPSVAAKSTPPPAPLVGRKPQPPRPVVAAPTAPAVAAPALVAAPAVAPAMPVAAPVSKPPPLPVRAPEPLAQQPSHTDIDLPPYFEPRPPSLVSDDEDSDPDLLRRFQSDVVERRKRLTRVVATVIGVAWMLCQIACARSIASSVADAITSDDEAPAAKAALAKDVAKPAKAKSGR